MRNVAYWLKEEFVNPRMHRWLLKYARKFPNVPGKHTPFQALTLMMMKQADKEEQRLVNDIIAKIKERKIEDITLHTENTLPELPAVSIKIPNEEK